MERNPIPYLNIQTLIEQGSGVVCFATAPDGLPLLTSVSEPPRAEQLLQQAAWYLGAESLIPQFEGTPLESLVCQLDKLLKNHLIQNLTTNDQKTLSVMLLPKLVQNLSGATLLSRLLTHGPTTIPQPKIQADTRPTLANAPVAEPVPESLPQPKFKLGQRCLALPLQGTNPLIVKKEASNNGWPQYSLLRTFLSESLLHLSGEYECKLNYSDVWQTKQVNPKEEKGYQSLRLQDPNSYWSFIVPRNAIARLILELAQAVANLQQTGEIHGDIKPSNVLITNEGVVLIDSLELASRMRSPAMTRGWAAPEQVMGLPVSFQTDQYPIGLMLLILLGGVLYGEETRVLIPIGGTKVETHTVLKPPCVYIDPDTAPVERQAIGAWSQFIAQCLRFEPTERFASIELLIEALQSLIEQQTLKGQIRMSLSFGTCVPGVDSQGNITPCWLVN